MLKSVFRAISRKAAPHILNARSLQEPSFKSLDDYMTFFDRKELQPVSITKNTARNNNNSSSTFNLAFEVKSSFDYEKLQNCINIIKESGGNFSYDSDPVAFSLPQSIEDLEKNHRTYLSAGVELESDHPGFHDTEYRVRRQQIADIAHRHKFSNESAPIVKYNELELQTWHTIFKSLMPEIEKNACQEYLDCLGDISKHCEFNEHSIPQISDINQYLRKRTDFQIMPIAGQLSSRDFLAHLAFRVFPSTQYVRHHSEPFYTPEPDIVHEAIGHIPLFGNTEFADFSQQIGLASLGASDTEMKKLAACYWFTIEFGISVNYKQQRKAYGAAVLSSLAELENAMNTKTPIEKFDPKIACNYDYPLTTLQPMYCYTEDFCEAKIKMLEYTRSMDKPFDLRYVDGKVQVFQLVNIEIYI